MSVKKYHQVVGESFAIKIIMMVMMMMILLYSIYIFSMLYLTKGTFVSCHLKQIKNKHTICIIKNTLKTYRVKKRTSSAQHGRVLNTSLYIPLKLNEPGYDVSVMRMLKNWQ